MRLLLLLLTALSWTGNALGRAVFAHFMVGNTEHYTASDWIDDIKLAQEAHIDAFALNMAKGEPMNEKAIASVFSHAETLGFKLFFSFDYAGRGPYSKSEVLGWINRYASSGAYFRHNGQPLVSTFEGPEQAEDWIDIKAQTGCFFVPDWSSLGAGPAVRAAGGVADGLFSWAGWPWGSQDMDTYVDASYREALGSKPYMMPVSPWFYTNLPGYNKNWLWRGDHLWYDRWVQVNALMPEWVQIISWNDYGESHHIGPIRDHALVAFDTGKAPYKYSLDHYGWRTLLPFTIDRYKTNRATITTEGVSFWYRPTPKNACKTGGTTGNTVSQLQLEFQPYDIIDDAVFYTALLTSSATVKVIIGGVEAAGKWRDRADGGGAGLWHGSSPFDGRTGEVRIIVSRDGAVIADLTGPAIKNDCRNGITGYDAWAGGRLTSRAPTPVTTPSLADEVCVRGNGANDFAIMCITTCFWGYCPETACVCTAMGTLITLPKTTFAGPFYPAEGLNSNYIGLCNYACTYGGCREQYCGRTQYPLIEPTVSPFRPPACISGTGDGDWEVLCNFACSHGFCPIARCRCTAQGHLDLFNPTQATKATSRIGDDHGLCQFGCSRGFCPKDACRSSGDGQQEQTSPPEPIELPHLDQDCYRFTECVDLDNPQSSSCLNGYMRQGYDKASCSGDYGRPICCKKSSVMPDACTWRGSGGDCNGQCHEGEATLFESRRGGTPGESGTGQCSRGKKVFCCELKTFKTLTSECRWSPCGSGCDADEMSVASARALTGYCSNDFLNKKLGQKYCCKTSQPAPFTNCHWVGQQDCADNNCNNKEVTLRTDPGGDSSATCFWSRKKSLCCTPNDGIFNEDEDDVFYDEPCNLDIPGCEPDEYAYDGPPEEQCPNDGKDELRRDSSYMTDLLFDDVSHEGGFSLEARAGGPRTVLIEGLWKAALRTYPSIGTLFQPRRNVQGPSEYIFRMANAFSPAVVTRRHTELESLTGLHTEHNPDAQMVGPLLRTVMSGRLPNGETTRNNARIEREVLERDWTAVASNVRFPRLGNSRCLYTPAEFFMDHFGSTGNRAPLVATEGRLNEIKGNIFQGKAPISKARFDELLDQALNGNATASRILWGNLRRVIGTFEYLRHPHLQPTLLRNRLALRDGARFISNAFPSLRVFAEIYEQFEPLWYEDATAFAGNWLLARLDQIDETVDRRLASDDLPRTPILTRTRALVLRGRLADIKAPPPAW